MDPVGPDTFGKGNAEPLDQSAAPFQPPNVFLGYVLPIVLLILTSFVTVLVGAYQSITLPVEGPLDILLNHPHSLLGGLPYAITLLLILSTHRFGYYILARYHDLPALLPLFWPYGGMLGGGIAFIRIPRGSISRRTLFDIGACGAILGFIVAVIGLIIGLLLTPVVPMENSVGFKLGEPLLLKGLTWLIHGDIPTEYDIVLHPIGFGSWHGLLFINLFLIPYARMDGAFVGHAVWGNHQRKVNWLVAPVLLTLGLVGWQGWIFWLLFVPLIGLLMGKRIPQVEDADADLGAGRIKIGWCVVAIFILTFNPLPFYYVG